MPVHRGSSLIFLGFSILAFIVTYGLVWSLIPTVLGTFFSVANNVTISDAGWAASRDKTNETLQWLIPLSAGMGMFILVLKGLMTASGRGRD